MSIRNGLLLIFSLLSLPAVAMDTLATFTVSHSTTPTLKLFQVTNSGFIINNPITSIQFEGATADGFEGMLTLVDPTADRTWTLPNASGTIPVSVSNPLTLSATGGLSILIPVIAGVGAGVVGHKMAKDIE